MMVLPVHCNALTTTLPANFLSERKVDEDGYNMTIMILNNVQHSRHWLFGSDTRAMRASISRGGQRSEISVI
jgi:hypothetical protein